MDNQPNEPLQLALAWQEAVNQKNTQQLLDLSDATIEIAGPKGTVQGHDVLREWSEQVDVSFTLQRVFAKGNAVVLDQIGVWKSADVGDIMGTAEVFSRFKIENQQVSQYARYDTLNEALAEAGLTLEDEMKEFRKHS